MPICIHAPYRDSDSTAGKVDHYTLLAALSKLSHRFFGLLELDVHAAGNADRLSVTFATLKLREPPVQVTLPQVL